MKQAGFDRITIVVMAAFLTAFAIGSGITFAGSSKAVSQASGWVQDSLAVTNIDLSDFLKGECTMSAECTSASTDEVGVVGMASPYAVGDTTERVVRVLEQAGMTIFARIDQQTAARAVGLTMRPMILVLFGNPKGGTPLMQAYPSLAIDLPLKALVWEDEGGQVWVSTNSPEYLQRRHGLAQTPFVGVPKLLEQALQ